jgi:hypothetical protein
MADLMELWSRVADALRPPLITLSECLEEHLIERRELWHKRAGSSKLRRDGLPSAQGADRALAHLAREAEAQSRWVA